MPGVKLPPVGTEKPTINEKALKNVLKDEAFMENLMIMQTPEDVQKALHDKGVDLTLTDIDVLGQILNKMDEKGTIQLTEKDFDNIVGGVYGEENKAVAKNAGKTVLNIVTLGGYNAVKAVQNVRMLNREKKIIDPNTGKEVIIPDEDFEQVEYNLQAGAVANIAGTVVGALAIAGATTAILKRHEIKAWFKKKFSKKQTLPNMQNRM